MSQVTVGRWGKNLAVRVPLDIEKAAGLNEDEVVDIDAHDGEIIIHRDGVHSRDDARSAAEEIIVASCRYSLGKLTIRDLIDEGRRW